MKKWVLLISLSLILSSLLPVFAQDTPGTVADVLTNQGEFTTLLGAIQAADPTLLQTLSDPTANVTVFAPTDAAFAALAEEVGQENVDVLLSDPAQLTKVLSYHVVGQRVASADITTALASQNNLTLRTLEGQYLNVFQENGTLFVDDAQVDSAQVDIPASNGVIHVIDRVLLPEPATIAEIISQESSTEQPEFIQLLGIILMADPTLTEGLFNPESEYTLFAPTDEAVVSLGQETLDRLLSNSTVASSVLKYHLLEGRWGSQEILDLINSTGGQPLVLPTLGGATITIRAEGQNIFVNDLPVILSNLDASNGVIHVLSGVLLPPLQ